MGNGPFDRNTSGNNLVNWTLQAIFCVTATTTYTPGTGGPSAKTVTPPFKLALMTAAGTDTGNGTEATTGNCPGYATLAGGSAPSVTFSSPAAGVLSTSNSQSYTATGSWTTIAGIEIWDNAATKLRYLQSGNSTFSNITGIASGDTVQFASAAVSYDGSAW